MKKQEVDRRALCRTRNHHVAEAMLGAQLQLQYTFQGDVDGVRLMKTHIAVNLRLARTADDVLRGGVR